jgi:hypothetical protein
MDLNEPGRNVSVNGASFRIRLSKLEEATVTELKSISWFAGVVVLILWLQLVLSGEGAARQDTSGAPPAVHLTAEQDHQRLMELLHFTSLRRGADGDPKSPNAANYDESKANPYPKLPDALRLKNGKDAKTAKKWWEKRRPEIVEVFDREIYGVSPKDAKGELGREHRPRNEWGCASNYEDARGPRRQLSISVHIKSIFNCADNAGKHWGQARDDGMSFSPEFMADHKRFPEMTPRAKGPTWQRKVAAKGWGYGADSD